MSFFFVLKEKLTSGKPAFLLRDDKSGREEAAVPEFCKTSDSGRSDAAMNRLTPPLSAEPTSDGSALPGRGQHRLGGAGTWHLLHRSNSHNCSSLPTSEKVLPCPGCGLGKPVSDIPRLHFCNLNRSLNCTLIQSVWGQRSLSLLRDTLQHVFTTDT